MAAVSESVPQKDYIVRFDIHQRIQHLILMVSFILLALTGLPIKFHDWSISQSWIGFWGGIDNVRMVHHYAAWAMGLDVIYHLGYLGYTTFILKRPLPIRMLPTWQDIVLIFREIKYFIGLQKDRPQFDRFNWREKFDYWAIFWGMPVMFITGFIMRYPVFTTDHLPGWLVPCAMIAHGDEAMLAVAWIAGVHIFFNHFAPSVFPFNKSIFTGKVSRARYRHEHYLEYTRIYGSVTDDKTIPEHSRDYNQPIKTDEVGGYDEGIA